MRWFDNDEPIKRDKPTFDDDTVFWGIILGFFTGMIAWFFKLPQRGEDTRQDIANVGKSVIGNDPARNSLEQGRRIARQRHERLQDR